MIYFFRLKLLLIAVCLPFYTDAFSDIGVICSTEKEVDLVVSGLSSVTKQIEKNRSVTKGRINNIDVVIIRSRMGKSMNAATAQYLYDRHSITQIVSIGFSGSLNDSIRPGSVIYALEAGHHDYGAYKSYGFVRREDLLERNEKKMDVIFSDWVFRNDNFLVKIASGDQFIESKIKKEWIRKSTKAQVVDMSSASIYDVCVINDISCAFIRQISDEADEVSQESYRKSVRAGGALGAVEELKKYLVGIDE